MLFFEFLLFFDFFPEVLPLVSFPFDFDLDLDDFFEDFDDLFDFAFVSAASRFVIWF